MTRRGAENQNQLVLVIAHTHSLSRVCYSHFTDGKVLKGQLSFQGLSQKLSTALSLGVHLNHIHKRQQITSLSPKV